MSRTSGHDENPYGSVQVRPVNQAAEWAHGSGGSDGGTC